MNIFIMLLAVLLMGVYYMMSAPSQRMQEQETTFAVARSDMRAIAECAAAVHNAKINGTEFEDICVEQNNIRSEQICLNERLNTTKCEITRNKKPAYSYIITATQPLDSDMYNSMLEILEQYYPDSGTFGIYMNGQIVSGGMSNKRDLPAQIAKQMEITDGQLVYMTQFEIPTTETYFSAPDAGDIDCPAGTVKTYRFGRWQCVGYNMKTNCGGDMIWDSDLYECVPDESRKPLCAQQQTAVIVDDVWECINPFPDRNCPGNMILRLNYNTLEWECVSDPAATKDTKKCANAIQGAVYGAIGATLRVPTTSCTDCEKMITDEETCASFCVPDESKLGVKACYPGTSHDCNDAHHAFYFGFPSQSYASHFDTVAKQAIPIGGKYSQNRKFNCMECPNGIDKDRSMPPYIVVCK